MAMSRDEYIELLKGLLPRGSAWPRSLGSQFHKLFEALAEEFARFDVRLSKDLINEVDPRTTLELITDWERVTGFPDECQGVVAEDIIDRRNDVVRKLTARGGASHQFFIDLAATIDYPITITEFRLFRSGKSRCGDRCYGVEWLSYWRVSTPSVIIRHFRSGQSRSGDRLATWRNNILECVINGKKPAHTNVIFTYGG